VPLFFSPMLKCTFKSTTGLDCPGCGLQRAFLALLEGDLLACFLYWPGLLPILMAITLTILSAITKRSVFMSVAHKLYILTGVLVVGNWILKLIGVIPCPV
jgi:hypothetical protein